MQENIYQINKRSSLLYIVGICILLFSNCKPLDVIHTKAEGINTAEIEKINEDVVGMVAPYKIQLDEAMEVELAILDHDLVKEQPESTLGNHVAEITFWSAQNNFDGKIDFAISNYGGLRVPYIEQGALKVKDAYQIMPFDNYVVIMTVPGTIVKQLVDKMASYKGWPVYNMRFEMKEGTAINITINGADFDETKSYTFGITDYLANGGDKLSFLKEYEYINTNVYLRNAIMEFWKDKAASNQHINVVKDGRVKVADE